jgi:hypothetical protein
MMLRLLNVLARCQTCVCVYIVYCSVGTCTVGQGWSPRCDKLVTDVVKLAAAELGREAAPSIRWSYSTSGVETSILQFTIGQFRIRPAFVVVRCASSARASIYSHCVVILVVRIRRDVTDHSRTSSPQFNGKCSFVLRVMLIFVY